MDLAEPRIHKEINAKAITGEQGNDAYDNLPIIIKDLSILASGCAVPFKIL